MLPVLMNHYLLLFWYSRVVERKYLRAITATKTNKNQKTETYQSNFLFHNSSVFNTSYWKLMVYFMPKNTFVNCISKPHQIGEIHSNSIFYHINLISNVYYYLFGISPNKISEQVRLIGLLQFVWLWSQMLIARKFSVNLPPWPGIGFIAVF